MKKPKTLYRKIHGPPHRGRRRDPFYDSARWRKIRQEVLSDQPFCADPFKIHELAGGEVVPSHDVDHIVPRSVDPSRELDLTNLQGLCQRCHSLKTRKEER